MTKVSLEIWTHVLNPSLIFKVKGSLHENIVYQHGPSQAKLGNIKGMLTLSLGPA